MKNEFKKMNLGGAWISFGIAALVYFKTQEASGSWWDCGEFMSAAFKLEIVHEPGSPLFLMLGKLFSLWATRPDQVHIFINALSSLASAGTIGFLFLTITHFAKKLASSLSIKKPGIENALILISGFIGAMSFTFSDTFWFSAVESEVYALSSFFTALVFWAILKWEEEFDENPIRADRWLLLIAFAMGLSIGVHLLNLLTIPALVFVYYFKKYKIDFKGIVITSCLSLGLLASILFILIPYTLKIATWVDIYSVNEWAYPFNRGALIFIMFLFLAISLGIGITRKKGIIRWHKILLSLFFILVGYSSYFMVILRAQANPPLNNSNPNTVGTLSGYLAREQYEEAPIFWGPDYTSQVKGVSKGEMEYRKGNKVYEEKGPKLDYTYEEGDTHFFPRLWSREKASEYSAWLGLGAGQKPDLGDNIRFFWSYQMDYMYWRYFLWNFAGRQNDTPSGFPNPIRGNWLSGIPFLDALHLGDQSTLPNSLKSNKAYNRLFFLPLIFGLLGMIFQVQKKSGDFTVILLLFVFTGLALAFYLNMPPGQPRERDYAFVGSFYAFSIWIGLGCILLFKILSNAFSDSLSLGLCFFLSFLLVPLWMGREEWDDHDRSNRTVVKDFAANYLNSCSPNAILFTYGDNETYPLWYAQEVEGIRTDIRVINLNLWDADWCIDKAKLKVNQSDPLPISWTHDEYKDGIRDYLSVKTDSSKKYWEIKDALQFALRSDPEAKDEYGENYLPTHHLKLSINPEEVIQAKILEPWEKSNIVPEMDWDWEKESITKGQLIFLDIINQNHWKRPIYFCSTSGEENFMGLGSYLREEGITLRLVPVKKAAQSSLIYSTNIPVFYSNVMKKFKWGNIRGNIHIDDQTNSFADSFKDMFLDLARSLHENRQRDSSIAVLDRESEVLPEILPPLGNALGESDFRLLRKAELYIEDKAPEKALPLLKKELFKIEEEIRFIQSQGSQNLSYYERTLQTGKNLIHKMKTLAKEPKLIKMVPLLDKIERNIP